MSRSRTRNEIPAWPPASRGLHRADEEVGADAVGDEGLRAVDDVAAVDLAGIGLDRGDVGAGARLGDPERADLLAGDRRAKEALVLLGGAEPVDRRSRDPGVRAEPGADPARGAGRGQLLGPDGVVDVVAALASELDRVLESEEAELARRGRRARAGTRAPPPSRRRWARSPSRTQRLIVSRSCLVLLGERRQQRAPPESLIDLARHGAQLSAGVQRRRTSSAGMRPDRARPPRGRRRDRPLSRPRIGIRTDVARAVSTEHFRRH